MPCDKEGAPFKIMHILTFELTTVFVKLSPCIFFKTLYLITDCKGNSALLVFERTVKKIHLALTVSSLVCFKPIDGF